MIAVPGSLFIIFKNSDCQRSEYLDPTVAPGNLRARAWNLLGYLVLEPEHGYAHG
jgi:hypothetical protein